MIGFNVVNREYIPTVDLSTVDKSANTLEQGHKEAVKAASDLKLAVAQMPMHSDEDGFKQNLVGEIQKTISDNLVFGNAAGAVDDVMMQYGNIMSDPRVLGRVKANADYENYKKQVESNNQLTQLYKDYYLANNPYHYEDKVDEKTGQIIGGSDWKPNDSPTAVVDYSQILAKAISQTAIEEGGRDFVRYIDENGAYTNDPRKAVGGQYADKTTVHFSRRTKEKMWKSVNALLKTTPGAMESIDQDMKVYAWQANEETKKDKNHKPFVNLGTDNQGNLLTKEQYITKLFDEGLDPAVINNSTSSISIGGGGAAYAAMRGAATGSGGNQTNADLFGQGDISTNSIPIKFSTNKAADYTVSQAQAFKSIHSLYQQLTGRPLVVKDGETIGNINQLLSKYDNLDPALKSRLLNNIAVYNEATKGLNNYMKNMTDEEKRVFNFGNRVVSGGRLISKENGGSQYDDQIITQLNKLKSNNVSDVVITAEPEYIKLLADKIKNYRELGIKFDNNQFTIPANVFHRLPMLGSYINQIEKANDNDYIPFHTQKRFNIASVSNGQVTQNGARDVVLSSGKIADKGYAKSKTATDRVLGSTQGTLSIPLYGFGSYRQRDLKAKLDAGLIKPSEYSAQSKEWNDIVDNSLAGNDFAQNRMFVSDDNGEQIEITDPRQRIAYGEMIKNAIGDKHFHRQIGALPDISFEDGGPLPVYSMRVPIYTTKKDSGSKYISGYKNITVAGIYNDDVSESFKTSPSLRSYNLVEGLNQTKGVYDFTSRVTNKTMGDITLRGRGNNNYEVDIFNVTNNIGREMATNLAKQMMTYNTLYGQVDLDRYNSDAAYRDRADQLINPIVMTVVAASGSNNENFIQGVKDKILKSLAQ